MKRFFTNIKQFPSAIIGLVLVLFLVAISIYTVIAIPYDEAIREWRGGEEIRSAAPKNARPLYVNWFTTKKISQTIELSTENPDDNVEKITEEITPEMFDTNITFEFDFPFDTFPREMHLITTSNFEEKAPFLVLTWHTPDEREIKIGDVIVKATETYRFTDPKLIKSLNGTAANIGLFAIPDSTPKKVLQGTYKLHIRAITFEEDSQIEARFVLFGEAHGIAGTDHRRRDLSLALLWGTPIALSFGLLAALGTTFITMFIAAVGVWYGGWVDELIQRITEIQMVLPFLPILIMVGTFYSRSIWVMLGVVIVISIFGAGIKNYRAIFLQIKESAYIEAARSYGASSWRIIYRYLVPRIIPVLIPSLVSAIPAYVFLEASLAVLGLGDPVLPTWGKVINDAQMKGALHNGYYYWVLQPAVLLMFTGLGFTMIGFALDRIFNPKLREV